MTLRIGVRGSKLALAYADKFCNLLSCDYEIVTITTTGDIRRDIPLSEIGGKGLFCNAIEEKLLNKEIDVAVHSLKDIPAQENPDLSISAVLKRNSPYDVIVGEVFKGCTIGTSSPRRTAQLKKLYKNLDITIKFCRGNIDTRLKKLDNKEFDAIVLAEAGIQELALNVDYVRLPIMPAIGQGIIALQTRKDDLETIEILQNINDEITFKQAQIERSFLKGIDGDCHTKVAGIATGENPVTFKAEYYD